MFTFGIFTTHIPYLAFVAFYAYFLLFGVSNASSGEIQFGENQHKIEIFASNHYQGSANHAYHFEKASVVSIQNSEQRHSLFKQKITYPVFQKSEYRQNCVCPTLFSRPPPAA